MLDKGFIPVTIVHVRAPAQTCVCLGWWASTVVIITPYWTIVVVPGHRGCGIIYSGLPVRTVQRGAVAAHARN